MLTILLWALLFLLAFPYVVFSRVVRLFSKNNAHKNTSPPIGNATRSVSVLIPAHNEEDIIAAKIENTLQLEYPKSHIEILVGCDGCTDHTATIASSADAREITVVATTQRQGKAATLNRLLSSANGELALLTDASAMLNPDALKLLVDCFLDTKVAAAGARYVVCDKTDNATCEASIWNRDARLKTLQSERDMLIGLHGAAYVVRRDAIAPLPRDTINDDFVVPLRCLAGGYRVVYEPRALVTESPTPTWRQVFARQVRISTGNYQMLWRHRACLRQSQARVAFSALGHKLLKTVGSMLAACFLAVAVAGWITGAVHPCYAAVAAVGVFFGMIGLAATDPKQRRGRLFQIAGYGLLVQMASLIAATRFSLRRTDVLNLWRRPQAVRHPIEPCTILAQPAPIPARVRFCKRLIDIVGACTALVLVAPLMALTALAVRLDSKGPIFHRQRRVRFGRNGIESTFSIVKFRTMCVDAEKTTGPVWTIAADSRITRVGRLLRRTRIDELPQLLSVLKGDMSLVGPRPERPYFVNQLRHVYPAYDDRLKRLQPGLTGWAQVRCGYDTSIEGSQTKLLYDLAYHTQMYRLSDYLRAELRILVETLGVVISGRGAH